MQAEVVQDSEEAPLNTALLQPNDLGKVFDDVYEARDKWYEFGLQLGVDDTTLASIESEQRGDVAKCLRKMLAQWLSEGYCTVSHIIKTLGSITVGKVALANRLEHTLASHVLESRKRGRSPESDQTEFPIPKRVCGLKRSNFAEYLGNIYNTTQLPSDKKYDLSSVKHYINLVCMKKNDNRDLAVHGDIPESITKESSVDLADIAPKVGTLVLIEGAPGIGKTTLSHELCRQWSSGSLLTHYRLVLLIKLRDKNMQQASNFDDLLKYISKDCLASSFESIHSEVTQNNGSGVLFILEGLDELQASAREDENSVFMKLIGGRLLPACTVMVTTRPWALVSIPAEGKHRIDQHIEIVGFTIENISGFIDSVIEEGIRQSVYDYVKSNPHILSAMYNPLCAQIVLCVYKEYRQDRGHSIPHTMTELYTSYTNIILKSHASNFLDCAKIEFADLPPSMKIHFDHICKIAYEGIMRQDQMLVFHVENPREFETLGLMRCVQPLYQSATNRQSSFHFVHFTLQEFMAAVHILNYKQSDVVKLFEIAENQIRYSMTLKFLAGLTKFSDQDSILRSIFPLSTTTPRHRNIPLYWLYSRVTESVYSKLFCHVFFSLAQISWLHESQCEQLFLPYRGDNTIVAFTTRSVGTTQEYFELGYCIAACGAIVNLEVDCTADPRKLQMLISGIRSVASRAPCHIQYLSVIDDWPDREVLLDSLLTELCQEGTPFNQASPMATHSTTSVSLPLALCTMLKELHVSNSTIMNISNLKSLQKLAVRLDSETDLQPQFYELSRNTQRVSLEFSNPGIFSAINRFNKFGYSTTLCYNAKSFSACELMTEQLSRMSLQPATVIRKKPLEAIIADPSCACAVESLKLHPSEAMDSKIVLTLSKCGSLMKLSFYGIGIAVSKVEFSCLVDASLKTDLVVCVHVSVNEEAPNLLHSIVKIIESCFIQTFELDLNSGLVEEDVIVLMESLSRNTLIKNLNIYVESELTCCSIDINFDHYSVTFEHSSESKCIKFTSQYAAHQFYSIPALHLESKSSLAIGKMLRENRTLEFLEMVYLTIDNGPHYIYPILEALCQNATLKTLLLHKRQHTIKCQSLPLTMDECRKSESDIVYDLLTKNQTLEILEVSLYPEHYSSLLKGLHVNKVLTELYVPREHASYVIECPEYHKNAHRIQFTDPFKYYRN